MIAEYWRGQITLRQLRVLAQNLPTESVWQRKMRGHQWQDAEYLLAAAVDRIGEAAAGIIRSNGSKAKPPKPLKRPDEDAGQNWGNRGDRSSEDVKAYLDSLSPTAA